MIRRRPLLAAVLPLLLAAAPPPPEPTPADIVAAAPAADWQGVAPEDMLVMDLAGGGRVVIALAPDFTPVHVANIRRLTAAHWWDGTSINRVQDDYVVQWGDATEKKPLPPALTLPVPAEYDRPAAGLRFRPLPYRDTFAARAGPSGPFAAAGDGARAWAAHCYGTVGVGRDPPPDTGTGAELYAVIGHGPRQLDRNIAVVGRVLAGMERLAALPRGTAALGFYDRPEQRVPILRVRIAADLPPAERPAFQYLRPESPSYARWMGLRANRSDAFYVRPAGAVDLCNALPPVRETPRG